MKLYVGNLDFSVTQTQLSNLFEPYAKNGKIEEVVIITDRFSGSSRGFAFITFSNQIDGLLAIKEMNGKEIENRTLKVNKARDRFN